MVGDLVGAICPAVAGRGLDLGRSGDREANHQGGERERANRPLACLGTS